MTCTRSTMRCLDARDYRHELADCCRGHVIALMREIVPRFSAEGIVWWADYGTLLGAVRNPMTTWADYPWLEQEGRETPGPHAGIIPHDKDGDICFLAEYMPAVVRVAADMRKRGYAVRDQLSREKAKFKLSIRNATNVDAFGVRTRYGGTMYREHYAQVDLYKGKEFHRDMLFPLSTVEWEGMTLPAPHDPEAFLEFRYGPNWRTPIAANNDGVLR